MKNLGQFVIIKSNLSKLLFSLILLHPFSEVFAQKKKDSDKVKSANLNSYRLEKSSDEVQKLFLDAIKANDTTKVRLLLSNGASANYCAYGDAGGYTYTIGEKPCVYGYSNYNPNFHWAHPLLYAICSDARDVINFLPEFEPRLINSQCLHAAIFKNDTALFNFFLEKGANPNLYGNELIQKYRNEGIHGMAPYMGYKYWWNSHAAFSGTPIDYALSSGRMQFVEKLIQMGASISQQKKDDLLLNKA